MGQRGWRLRNPHKSTPTPEPVGAPHHAAIAPFGRKKDSKRGKIYFLVDGAVQ